MRTANGIPEFEDGELKYKHTDKTVIKMDIGANDKLRSYFAKRKCVNCICFKPGTIDRLGNTEFPSCGLFQISTSHRFYKPEDFSCSEFKEKL